MKKNRILTLVAALGLGVSAPAAFGADTVGPPLSAPTTTNLCGAGALCTYIAGTPTAPLYPIPADGVVTGWRVQSGSAGGEVTIRVLRLQEGRRRVVSVSEPQTTVAGIGEYTTRLAVKKGDIIGLANANSSLIMGPVGGPTSTYAHNVPDMSMHDDPVQPLVGSQTVVPLVQVVVEPDADGDGYGDETQDACLGDATKQVAPCRAPFTMGPLTRPARLTLRQARKPVQVSTRISRSATVTVTVTALRPGRRAGKVCAPREIQMIGASCQASVVVRQTTRNVAAGLVRIPVNLGGLAVGRYSLRIEATDREGSGITRARAAIVQIRTR